MRLIDADVLSHMEKGVNCERSNNESTVIFR